MNKKTTSAAPTRLGAIISESLGQTNAQAPAISPTQNVMDMLRMALQAEVGKRGRNLIINDEMRVRMAKVAEWLTTDTHPFLMLCGGCGNGKTTMMRAIASVVATLGIAEARLQGNRQKPSRHEPLKKLKSSLQMKGKSLQPTMLTMREEHATELNRSMKYAYPEWKTACNAPLLGIDDLGEEPTELRNYGNYLRPMTELLQRRYDQQQPTVITTNLTPRQIGEKYGERIADRLAEAVLNVPFLSPSYRATAMSANPEAVLVESLTEESSAQSSSEPSSDVISEQS